MASASFETVIKATGNNTGIEVPDDVLAELGGGRRPPVEVTIDGYTYQGSVGSMGGVAMVSLAKAHREAAGVAAGQRVTVTLELQGADRAVVVPSELSDALDDAGLAEAFAALAYSKRKEHCRQVAEAKAPDTRRRRVAKVIASLAALSNDESPASDQGPGATLRP